MLFYTKRSFIFNINPIPINFEFLCNFEYLLNYDLDEIYAYLGFGDFYHKLAIKPNKSCFVYPHTKADDNLLILLYILLASYLLLKIKRSAHNNILRRIK